MEDKEVETNPYSMHSVECKPGHSLFFWIDKTSKATAIGVLADEESESLKAKGCNVYKVDFECRDNGKTAVQTS